MQKGFSCSSAFRGNPRVTRKLWKSVQKVPQNLTRIKVFLLDFQMGWKIAARNPTFSLCSGMLSGPLSGFWVRNRPRAPIPWIMIERQAADLSVFLENRIPKPSIFLRFYLVFWTRRRWKIGLQNDQKNDNVCVCFGMVSAENRKCHRKSINKRWTRINSGCLFVEI